jgi:hypothetical protein
MEHAMTARRRLPERRASQSGAGILASDAGVAASLALQYGCPLETIRKALMRDERGFATGPLGVALDLVSES